MLRHSPAVHDPRKSNISYPKITLRLLHSVQSELIYIYKWYYIYLWYCTYLTHQPELSYVIINDIYLKI